MTSYKYKIGMFFQQVITCLYLILIGRVFRMKEHMVLRIFREISAVAADCHFIERQPAVTRFTKMPGYGDIFEFYKINNRIKAWIINHNEPAVPVAYCHSDILPNLHAYRAGRHIAFKLCDDFSAPFFSAPACSIKKECCTEKDFPGCLLTERDAYSNCFLMVAESE